MGSFVDAAASFPTAVFSTLLAVVLFYWVLAVLGIVDFDNGVDIDAGGDQGPSDLGTIAGYVVAFGLQGIPFSIILSLLVLVSWTLSCLGGMWLLPLLPGRHAIRRRRHPRPRQRVTGRAARLGACAAPARAVRHAFGHP